MKIDLRPLQRLLTRELRHIDYQLIQMSDSSFDEVDGIQ